MFKTKHTKRQIWFKVYQHSLFSVPFLFFILLHILIFRLVQQTWSCLGRFVQTACLLVYVFSPESEHYSEGYSTLWLLPNERENDLGFGFFLYINKWPRDHITHLSNNCLNSDQIGIILSKSKCLDN